MNVEIELALDQWEALKALRVPARQRQSLNRLVIEQLVALGLASETGDGPAITPEGRSVLLRGSPRLWDVAA
jgi:hypothetical protein